MSFFGMGINHSHITQYAKQGEVWKGFTNFGPYVFKKQTPPSQQEVPRCPKYIPRYLWPSSTSSENIGAICNHLHRLLQWFSCKMSCKNTLLAQQKHPSCRYLIQKNRTCLMFVRIKIFWDELRQYYCFLRIPEMSETCWMPRNVTGTL